MTIAFGSLASMLAVIALGGCTGSMINTGVVLAPGQQARVDVTDASGSHITLANDGPGSAEVDAPGHPITLIGPLVSLDMRAPEATFHFGVRAVGSSPASIRVTARGAGGVLVTVDQPQ